jgi:hypothetical protein
MEGAMNKQPPTLEQRIVSTLANDHAGSEDLMELLAEVEASITLSDENIFTRGMAVPYHPGSHWADPDEQARRRAESEKHHREIGEHYQRMTAEQEDRINREERERMAASRWAT